MLSKGIAPRKTVFQTQKEYLRTAIAYAAASSCNMEEFQATLLKKLSDYFKSKPRAFQHLHPERNKFITGRSLGPITQKIICFQFGKRRKNPKINLTQDQIFSLLILTLLLLHLRKKKKRKPSIL